MQKMIENKAITLVALVITIIILIILAGVTMFFIFNDDGIISRTKEASFKSNLSEVEEKVILYWTNKEQDAIVNGTNPTVYEKLPIKLIGDNGTTVDKSTFKDSLITEVESVSAMSLSNVNLYEIDKSKIATEVSHTYLIDIDTFQVYDKEGEKFGGKTHHTLKSLEVGEVGNIDNVVIAKRGETSPEEYKTEDGDGWLKPDMTGFGMQYVKLEYYNKDDFSDIKEIQIQAYIDGGRKSKFEENGKTYVLDGYNEQMWANAVTYANGLETWWVWQPRYAYKINGVGSIDIIFINMSNKPIGDKYSGKYTVNNDGTITINAEEGDTFGSGTYIVHPGFTVTGKNGSKKELQGTWMSKYSASSTEIDRHTSDSGECYPPDMSGFDPQNTYIELYDTGTDSFIEEVKLADANLNTINSDNRWYDYKNRIWANIKTYANGIECWWVWQPRYAYSISGAAKETTVLFVDTDNKPYDKATYGNDFADGMKVHPGFTVTDENGNKKELRGIWVSKYSASTTNTADKNAISGECLKPDLSGFDTDNQEKTYVIYWSEDLTKTREVLVKDYISGGEQRTITYDGETYTFYDYKNKIWANIKTTANDLECWWVWQPRYAYNISKVGQETDVVFVGLDNTPVDKASYGSTLKEGMIVHPGFTVTDENGNTKELKGIWMSKYSASWK